jgi:hypothetical protein
MTAGPQLRSRLFRRQLVCTVSVVSLHSALYTWDQLYIMSSSDRRRPCLPTTHRQEAKHVH